MSRPRFLADHDLQEAIVRGVRRKEPAAEFAHLRDVGLEQASDPDVLEYAARTGFLVVSHDVNTMCGHAYARIKAGRPLAGVFLVQQGHPLGPVIEDLLLIWSGSEAEEWADRVTHLPLPASSL